MSNDRVKLLLRYVDHLRGCASYTNGACTCGFENAMQDLDRDYSPSDVPSVQPVEEQNQPCDTNIAVAAATADNDGGQKPRSVDDDFRFDYGLDEP